ncbi:MAG TPA: S8 family serine peptidase [Actinomycetota bacterium]
MPAEAVTLVTGDRVLVRRTPDGAWAATVLPTDPAVTFETIAIGDDLYVIPDSAAPLVPELLDRELFNVAELVRRDLDDASTGRLPLIVEHEPGAAPTLPATEETTALDSIDGAATLLDKDRAERLGDAIAESAEPGGDDPLEGVQRIWLDAEVGVALDRSVAQIRADVAHARGIDGTGVRVAVLDTGIDTTHPDLQGKVSESRNFTTSASTSDGFGHGTHVASIIAGSGAASNGAYRGVAPGATILNGKVLGDNGSGLASWVIGGMEWAVDSGADVVNMSLGGGATDGTDPMSVAVNTLTAESGALFVIAAGNNGPLTRTIGTPGAADAALTVGAVSRTDSLAFFSSRGPRLGDFAIKPDLTAPGVDIVAARAAGTSMGTPVDARYTRASGTSMATPHAAGAAALLLQGHPGWEAGDVKSALVTSAVPRAANTVYEQGGGRLDVGRAVDDPVRASPAPLQLGFFPWPHGARGTSSRTVTFTNPATAPATLDLALEIVNEDGAAPAPGMLSLSPATVSVPAGGTAEAEVTIDPDVGDTGTYGGYLVGRRGETVELRVPLGFTKELERYDLTVQGIGAGGLAAGGFDRAYAVNVDDPDTFFEDRSFIDGTAVFRVPPGTYEVVGSFRTWEGTRLKQLRWVIEPELEVAGDAEVALDARTAIPIRVAVPGYATVARQMKLEHYRGTVSGDSVEIGHVIGYEVEAFAAPTEPVTKGAFEFNSQFRLVAPDVSGGPSSASPYLFDLIFPKPDAIPAALDEVADPAGLARIDAGFAVQGAVRDYEIESRGARRPWQFFVLDIGFPVAGARTRADHVSPGDTLWAQSACLRFFNFEEPYACLAEGSRTYAPGERTATTWYAQPSRPIVATASRTAQELTIVLDPVADAAGHGGTFVGGYEQELLLYQEGALAAESSEPLVWSFTPDERQRFRLEYETSVAASWAEMSTRTATTWEFDSGPQRSVVPILDDTSGYQEVPSLLLVDYLLGPLDLRNRAPFPDAEHAAFPLGIRVSHLPGASGGPVAEARMWASYDDGGTWQEVTLSAAGGGEFVGQAAHPRLEETNGFVSLRAEASDSAGNTVSQTVVRAYGLTPPHAQRVNAGDGAYTDGAGTAWAPDQPYTPGGWGYTNVASDVQTVSSDIAGTTDDALYRAIRLDPGSYRFDVPDGRYAVTLRFAEPAKRAAGTRVFDVLAEGAVVLADHDTTAEVGNRTADQHVITVLVTDGTLDLDFRRRTGSAQPAVAAIGIAQAYGGPTAP